MSPNSTPSQPSGQLESQTQADALQRAEQRAEKAERQLEELREKVETLEEHQPVGTVNVPYTEPHKAPRPRPVNVPDTETEDPEDAIAALRNEPMMAHLLDSLYSGRDIGHYGRLVFTMIAHHFLPEEEILNWLTRDPDFSEEQAQAMLRQVEARDYNPPRRERILEWQSQQEFPILPNPDDPDCGNVYRNLKFPPKVYNHIQEYQEEKAEASS